MTHRRKIEFPDVIGVQLGSPDRPNVVPAELCTIPPGQVYKAKLSEHLTDQARTFATKSPSDRLNIIINGVSGRGQKLLSPVCHFYRFD